MAVALWVAAASLGGCAPQKRLDQEALRLKALKLNDEAAALLPEKPGKALRLLEEAERTRPGLAPVQNNAGLCLLLQDKYFEAAVAFKRAATLDPTDPRPLYNLGLTFERATNWEVASDYYEQALKLDPEDVHACENLIRVYVKLGRPRSEVASLARRALLKEMRPEWIAWLSRYAEADASAAPNAEPSPAVPPPADGQATPVLPEER